MTTNDSPEVKTKLYCNTSLRNWLKSIEDQNLLPFQQYDDNDQPFDADSPEIEINVSTLKQRYGISTGVCTKVVIQTQTGVVLFEGNLYNGRLKEKIDSKLAKHPAWRSRLVIGVADTKISPHTNFFIHGSFNNCLLYTSPSPRDKRQSRMPSSA